MLGTTHTQPFETPGEVGQWDDEEWMDGRLLSDVEATLTDLARRHYNNNNGLYTEEFRAKVTGLDVDLIWLGEGGARCVVLLPETFHTYGVPCVMKFAKSGKRQSDDGLSQTRIERNRWEMYQSRAFAPILSAGEHDEWVVMPCAEPLQHWDNWSELVEQAVDPVRSLIGEVRKHNVGWFKPEERPLVIDYGSPHGEDEFLGETHLPPV